MLPILLVCHDKKQDTARNVLAAVQTDCHKAVLTESHVPALQDVMRNHDIGCVIILGEKPRIYDKIAIEPCAVADGVTLHTPLDCTTVSNLLCANGCQVYFSKGCAGTKANGFYAGCLQANIPCILIQLPTAKHLSDPKAAAKALDGLLQGLIGVPCAL